MIRRLDLNRHPGTPSPVGRVMVSISRQGDRLLATFRLPDNLAALSLPAWGEPVRTDRLWEHSCFEIFIRPEGGTAYYEYNLSPSAEWAIYRFDDYRIGMAEADLPEPIIDRKIRMTRFDLSAELLMPSLRDLDWQVGVSAVIEEKNGNKSWWALAHPPGDPDFHHETCFALELPAATNP